MKYVPVAITNKVARQILQTQKHSPVLLFGAGVVGVVATTVLACRATLKLEEVLEETNEKAKTAKELHEVGHQNYSDGDYKQDKALIYFRSVVKIGKLYAPAVGLGIISIAALTGSHVILTRRNVALAGAFAALERSFSDYRQRVIDEIGEKREDDIWGALEKCDYVDEVSGKTSKVKRVTPGGLSMYARIFDQSSSRSWQKTPEYNQMFIRCQQLYANDLLRSRGHVFLNEVYDMLNLERSPAGQIVGWINNGDGDGYIDFGVFDGDIWNAQRFVNGDEKAIMLDFNVDGPVYEQI